MKDPSDAAHLASLPPIYLAAEYKWEWHGHWESLRIGMSAPDLETAFADAARFGLISGANPAHNLRPEPENRSADHALQQALEALGLRHRPAFVAAVGRSWKAFNWLVIDPDPAQFDALARRFGQIGTLLWARGEPVRLRMQARRPPSVAPHAFIDWIDEAGGALAAPRTAPCPADGS